MLVAALRSSRRVLNLRAQSDPSFFSATDFFSHNSRIFLFLKWSSKQPPNLIILYLLGKELFYFIQCRDQRIHLLPEGATVSLPLRPSCL